MSTASSTQFFSSRQVDGVLYRLASPDDEEQVADLMVTEFCARMPLYRLLGATDRSDVESTLALLSVILARGESVVAADPDDPRKLLGVRLSSTERRSEPQPRHPVVQDAELSAKYPKEATVMRFVDRLTTEAAYFSRYPTIDLALAARFLAVRESHGGRGIGRRLMECSIELAGILGAQLIVGATQNFYSQKIYESLSFERLHSIPIAEYVDPLTGKKPFESLEGGIHKDAVFFAKLI